MIRFCVSSLICLLFGISGCKCKDQKEIDNWFFGAGASDACPLAGALPVFVESKLSDKYTDQVMKAMERWNRVSRKMAGGRVFFAPRASLSKYKRPKGAGEWPVLLSVDAAPASLSAFGKPCAPMMRGMPEVLRDGALGWFEVRVAHGRIYGGRIQVCVGKYEAAIKMIGDPAATRVRQGGMYRILLHELGHALGGVGTKHPTWYGEVMRYAPANEAISYHWKDLLLYNGWF